MFNANQNLSKAKQSKAKENIKYYLCSSHDVNSPNL